MIPAEIESAKQQLENSLGLDETDDALLEEKKTQLWQWAKSFGPALFTAVQSLRQECKRLHEEILKWERKYGTFKE